MNLRLIYPSIILILLSISVIGDHDINNIHYSEQEIKCLSDNIYHESRGEPLDGKIGVAMVTLNRVKSPGFPSSVCSVVYQPYQFEWTRNKNKPIVNKKSYSECREVAINVMVGKYKIKELANSKYFYSHYKIKKPNWAINLKEVKRIRRHSFLE